MLEAPEIVIVGGGIAGGALATVLARQGWSAAVLERDPHPVDRVRGEWLAPWGVTEADRIGVLDILRERAGGSYAPVFVGYDENVAPQQAEAAARDLRDTHPLGTGPLCAGHPSMCEALGAAAATAGASVLRGVGNIAVAAGQPPSISFEYDGNHLTWRPRLIVGADGRSSVVRRQIGFPLLRDEPHNLIGGMLVDGVPQWPRGRWGRGTEGGTHHFVFPQGVGKLRLYLCYGFEDRARFTGAGRERNLLDTFAALRCVPLGSEISRAEPIGPFHSYSNEDHWVDRPVAPGIVLIGDAAGHNDPIIGQGLSIALRDVRIVSDILRDRDLRQTAFEPYVEERRERMRRLRVTARLDATLMAEFGPVAAARRARALRRAHVDKWLAPLRSALAGPETFPAEAFEQRTIEALLAD